MIPHTPEPLRELDHRVNDGIDVWMLWRAQDDRVLVAVADSRTGAKFTIEVGRDQRAFDVFHHPFAYAPDHSGETTEHLLAPVTGS